MTDITYDIFDEAKWSGGSRYISNYDAQQIESFCRKRFIPADKPDFVKTRYTMETILTVWERLTKHNLDMSPYFFLGTTFADTFQMNMLRYMTVRSDKDEVLKKAYREITLEQVERICLQQVFVKLGTKEYIHAIIYNAFDVERYDIPLLLMSLSFSLEEQKRLIEYETTTTGSKRFHQMVRKLSNELLSTFQEVDNKDCGAFDDLRKLDPFWIKQAMARSELTKEDVLLARISGKSDDHLRGLLLEAQKKSPGIYEDCFVYRGIQVRDLSLLHFNVDITFVSNDIDFALQYSHNYWSSLAMDPFAVLLAIHIPHSCPLICINDEEFLLPQEGYKLVVNDTKQQCVAYSAVGYNVRVIYCTLIRQAPKRKQRDDDDLALSNKELKMSEQAKGIMMERYKAPLPSLIMKVLGDWTVEDVHNVLNEMLLRMYPNQILTNASYADLLDLIDTYISVDLDSGNLSDIPNAIKIALDDFEPTFMDLKTGEAEK